LRPESRWTTHTDSAYAPAIPGDDLRFPLEARRCTVQLSTGRLYLDAVASSATSLHGHDELAAPAAGASAALQKLSSLEPGYTCVATTPSFVAAAQLASRLARFAAGPEGRILEVNALDGEPSSAHDFLIACENETIGRAGRWFASAGWRRPPGVAVLGEAISLGSSFGAVLARDDLARESAVICEEAREQAASRASLARVAAAIAAVESAELLAHGRQLADYLWERLLSVQATCPEIARIERAGLSFRIIPAPPLTAVQIRRRMCERGVLAGVDASGRLALDPPLPLRIAEADVITGALRSALLGLPPVSASVCCAACEKASA
jgi:adenosylmethionine-8-amino-7-oxononanoate aminotransferase